MSAGIKQQLQNHLQELNAMEPVAAVNSKAYSFNNKTDLQKQIVDEFKKSGAIVDRQGFGEVIFDKEAVGQIVSYIKDSDIGGLLAIKAAPAVAKRGIEIDYQKNFKNRGFDTVTFAAPVTINGTRGNVAVVVRKIKNNRAHCVRIVLPDGSAFKINSKKADTIFGSGLDTQVQKRNGSASKENIPDSAQNVKKKFSMNDSVEETRDLIAVHNLSADNLLKTLRLDGFPALSIEIAKAEKGWDKFGNVSVVFGKETIDPQQNADNHVFGADTWTPVFPEIYRRSPTMGNDGQTHAGVEFLGRDLVRELNQDITNKITPTDFVEKYRNDAAMMQAFHLDAKGDTVPLVFGKSRKAYVGNEKYDAVEKIFIDVLGEEKAERVFAAKSWLAYKNLTSLEEDKIADAVRQAGY